MPVNESRFGGNDFINFENKTLPTTSETRPLDVELGDRGQGKHFVSHDDDDSGGSGKKGSGIFGFLFRALFPTQEERNSGDFVRDDVVDVRVQQYTQAISEMISDGFKPSYEQISRILSGNINDNDHSGVDLWLKFLIQRIVRNARSVRSSK